MNTPGMVLGGKKIPYDEKILNQNVGYLIFVTADGKSGELFFQDAFMKRYTMDRVFFLEKEHNAESGFKGLPKPYMMDDKDKVTGYGDDLLYMNFGNTNGYIAILGSLRNILIDNFDKNLNYDPTSLQDISQKNIERNNKQRYLLVTDDGIGNFTFYLEGKTGDEPGTGNLSIKIKGADANSGNVKLEASGKVAIQQVQADGNGNDVVISQILMDSTKDAERIKVIDKYKNQVVFDKNGIALTDKSQNKITTTSDGIDVLDKNNNEIKTDSSGVTVNAQSKCNINSTQDCTVNATNVTITGGNLTVNGNVAPTGSGPFQAVPGGMCLFSGAPIAGNKVSGT